MDPFVPYIHKPERKKEIEPQPLYVELYPPMEKPPQEDEKEEESRVVVIELF